MREARLAPMRGMRLLSRTDSQGSLAILSS